MSEKRHAGGWPGQIGHWLAELLLVFVGAYAAFWLTNYQARSEDRRRHDQIVNALEQDAREAIVNASNERTHVAATLAEFRRAYAANEEPHIGTLSFSIDYSPTDTATLLQSGGYQLLDIKTITALRNLDNTLRAGVSNFEHIQKLSDELIAPNLDEGTDFFYDPATKRLRRRFARYPDALAFLVNFEENLIASEKTLLTQLQAEHHRGN